MIDRAIASGSEIAPAAVRAARWERPAWAALLVAALALRLYDLGVRVMTHDESIHAVGALKLFREGLYQHDPAYHGPLQYYVNAAVYQFLGATDFTARLAPALVGTLLVAGLWLFRRFLGRRGAFAAAALVASSPALLFYSRHLREDIYAAFFTLVWVYAAFRYVGRREGRWLALLAAGMALAFITKENSFLFGAIAGSFFALRAVLPAGERDGGREVRAASGDLAVVMLTLVLPFAAGLAYPWLEWSPPEPLPPARHVAAFGAVVAVLTAAAAAAALWRFPARIVETADATVTRAGWLRLMALFWGIQLAFFTALFGHPLRGILSGVGGSAGYWLTQHGVNRGGQPAYYYLLIGGLYELLPMLLGTAAMAAVAWRLRDRAWDPVDDGESRGAADADGAPARRLFALFAIWWTLGSWVLYAWAGERMPWLLVHQVLPLCLLAGWALAALTRGLGAVPRGPAAVLVAGTAAVAALAAGVFRTMPAGGLDVASVAAAAGWWTRALTLSLAVWVVLRIARDLPRLTALRLGALGLVLALGVLTIRTGIRVAFVNHDLAAEPLSYAQGSPDIRRVMQLIESLSERTAGARALEVAYDDESAWPLVWYLRDYPLARTWGTDASLVASAPVVLVGPKNRDALRPHVAGKYVRQTYALYWWPIQDYLDLTLSGIWERLRSPAWREHLWQVFFHRNYGISLHEWPARREFEVLVRNDIARAPFPGRLAAAAAGLTPSSGAAEIDWTPEQVIEGPFDGVPLLDPTALTVTGEGLRVVADTGNHRVLVLSAGGAPRLVIGGGRCALREPQQPGCVDPDGAGPRSAGDGQFNEPWGVAVDRAGNLFVADTWNGRIQVFDREGGFLRSWERFGSDATEAGGEARPALYGPRGVALDDAGNLIVADTGNKRLIVFSPTGAPLGTVGSSAPVPELLDEPTAIARDANHTLLVADAWNGRILRLDSRHHAVAVWQVFGWSSRAPADKPYLAVDRSGLVYASDPESGRVLVFSPAGALLAILRLPDADGTRAKPTGVAVDPATGQLLVADQGGGRVLVLPPFRAAGGS